MIFSKILHKAEGIFQWRSFTVFGINFCVQRCSRGQ